MAEKKCFEEDDQIDLGLDISFNEFEDEFQEETQSNVELLCKRNNSGVDTKVSGENVTESGVVENNGNSELSFGQSNLNKTEAFVGKELTKNTDDNEEDGQLLSLDEEMDLLIDAMKDDTAGSSAVESSQNIIRESHSSQGKGELKRKMDGHSTAFDVEADMDIDDGLLLDSDDESMSQEKKCKTEEIVEEDQPMKKSTRAGKKKKKKKNQPRQHYERIPQPIIGRLFKPLLATEDDAPEVLAYQLKDRLEEHKEELVLQVLKTIGNKKALEIFQETKKIQIEGGLSTVYGNRRRTSGGIFFHILKTKGYATKEQLKEIFTFEREKVKKLIKEEKERENELKEREVPDLREKLAEKRELLNAEDIKSES